MQYARYATQVALILVPRPMLHHSTNSPVSAVGMQVYDLESQPHAPCSARVSPEIIHKLMGFYMEGLILGVILRVTLLKQYMVSASLGYFLYTGCIGLTIEVQLPSPGASIRGRLKSV